MEVRTVALPLTSLLPITEVFTFSVSCLSEAIDRKALGGCVLGNDEAMKALEGIVHPLVAEEREAFLIKVGGVTCDLFSPSCNLIKYRNFLLLIP